MPNTTTCTTGRNLKILLYDKRLAAFKVGKFYRIREADLKKFEKGER